MVNKKYKLTKETKEVFGVNLHRIEALKDFSDVKKGDTGGWIEKAENLSQEGDAWVSGNAKVYGDAWVYGDAEVKDIILCSKFSFNCNEQIELWLKKEREYEEEVKNIKPKPKEESKKEHTVVIDGVEYIRKQEVE